jgi:hypothetical protein
MTMNILRLPSHALTRPHRAGVPAGEAVHDAGGDPAYAEQGDIDETHRHPG